MNSACDNPETSGPCCLVGRNWDDSGLRRQPQLPALFPRVDQMLGGDKAPAPRPRSSGTPVGCGVGVWSRYLSRLAYLSRASRSIRKIRRAIPRRPLSYHQARLANLSLSRNITRLLQELLTHLISDPGRGPDPTIHHGGIDLGDARASFQDPESLFAIGDAPRREDYLAC